jgi:carboxymethylenebutenolidase
VQGYKNEGLSSQHDCDPLLGSRKPLRRISEDGRRREISAAGKFNLTHHPVMAKLGSRDVFDTLNDTDQKQIMRCPEHKVETRPALNERGPFIEFLSSHPEVKGDRFGATGYCMGGNCSLTAAGALPDRFAAIASFHGGNLATDKPDSPHLLVKNITGRVYVAGAIEDASFPEEQKNRLEKALTEAGVDHLIETYPGARHGFAVPDVPVFDSTAAERHWAALFGLFRETLAVAR